MEQKKRIIVLGATGSIGRSAAAVVREHSEAFRVVAVAARTKRDECDALAREWGCRSYVGEEAALQAVEENEADVCLVATVGLSGLRPTLAAIDKGMDVALATKEVLVMAGELVMRRAREKGVRFRPVDSEHSAIFQCLAGASSAADVDRLILTASGGPFLDGPEDLSSVTPAQALNHPRWKMGPKVTVDSATMMNKGFELVEAKWLFGVPESKIDIVVHPESIVHSLVTFVDGATLAQLSVPDMRVAVQYALSSPRRLPSSRAPLDLASLAALTFRAPDERRFPALRLVKDALEKGGTAPAVLAAADEWAVQAFLDGRIPFTGIAACVEKALSSVPLRSLETADDVYRSAQDTFHFLASL